MNAIIDDTKTPADYLAQFYKHYQLGEDGGNRLPYVVLQVFNCFKFYIPNWDRRRKAVLRHDIHHILTGYKSELLGEFEIAGWEIGSGCMNYGAAYLLNSGGLLAGMLVYPSPTLKAFIRGCRSSNLYQVSLSDSELKNSSIHDLKKMIGLTSTTLSSHANFSELGKLVFHCLLSLILNGIILLFSPLLILYNIWMYGKKLF